MERTLLGIGLLSVALAGCGGGAQVGAKSPGAEGQGAMPVPAAGAGVATTPGGAQYAMSDLPTSGRPDPNRPQMSAAAADAYRAGLQAFQAGDLQGAKT